MNRSVSSLAAWLVIVAVLLIPGAARADLDEWKNKDGDTLEANALSYDLETKMVTFEMADESTFEYPIEDLVAADRLRVVTIPNVVESLEEQGWKFPVSYVFKAGLLALGLSIVLWLTFGFVCFWGAARLVTGEVGAGFHFVGFLKFLAINLVITTIGNTILLWPTISVLLGGEVPAERPEPSGFVAFLVFAASFVVPILVVSGHYGVGFFRGFFTLFVHGIFTTIAAILLLILAAFVIPMIVTQADFKEWAVDALFLKPIGLL